MSTTHSSVQYAERWLSRRSRPGPAIDADEARRRHEAGELYTAVLGDPERPTAYLDVRLETGYVGVHFLDDAGRPHLTYAFAREPGSDDDLFLQQATYREYEGMFHVWAAAVWLPESAEAIRHIAESVNRDTATG